jgi:hypothetical protein
MLVVERSLSLFHYFHNCTLANKVFNFFRVDIMPPTVEEDSLWLLEPSFPRPFPFSFPFRTSALVGMKEKQFPRIYGPICKQAAGKCFLNLIQDFGFKNQRFQTLSNQIWTETKLG